MEVRVFIAAPIKSGFATQFENIVSAIDAAEEVLALGACPYVPQLTSLWSLLREHEPSFWDNYNEKWLKTCNLVWRLSGGCDRADGYCDYARELGIVVVDTYAELLEAITSLESAAHRLELVLTETSSDAHSPGEIELPLREPSTIAPSLPDA